MKDLFWEAASVTIEEREKVEERIVKSTTDVKTRIDC
jgi:hypothetical protein